MSQRLSSTNDENSKNIRSEFCNWYKKSENFILKIDSLNFSELKKEHIVLEKNILELKKNNISLSSFDAVMNKEFELKYITMSLEFCKNNISNEQYSELNTFANILYESYRHNSDFNGETWVEILDNLQVPFSVQNQVSSYTHKYENKGFYLSTLLNKDGILVGTLGDRSEDLNNQIQNSDTRDSSHIYKQ